VHSETSTGALAPLQGLAEVTRSFEDVLLLVDGATSIAGCPVETDAWCLDFVFTGSHGALALPPGLALAVASERMVDRARRVPERGAYLDLLAYDKATAEFQPTNTPAVSLLFALKRQVERIETAGGVDARWERHDQMRAAVESWIEGKGGHLGFRFLPDKARRSWTVSCLSVPAGQSGRGLAKALEQDGWVIGSGYGILKHQTIRIGHMGDHSVNRLEQLLSAVGAAAAGQP
jgi:aspartate aminotransferase-like enzyme